MKLIAIGELRRLLDTLPSDYQVGAQTLANTGNLTLHYPDGRPYGFVDLITHQIEVFDEPGGQDAS